MLTPDTRFTIELTGAELKAIQQMVDIAVKARGMEVAAFGVSLNNKIDQVFQAAMKANGGDIYSGPPVP